MSVVPSLPSIFSETRFARELLSLPLSDVWKHPPRAQYQDQPVMLLCGLFAGDASLKLMADWLERGGWRPRRAGISMNIACSEKETERLIRRLERVVADAGGRPAVLIGHSRGGVFARVLAVRRPDLVQGVVTLGSPLLQTLANVNPLLALQIELTCTVGDRIPGMMRHSCADPDMIVPNSGVVNRIFDKARSAAVNGCCLQFWKDVNGSFPDLPFVSIYSPSDAIVYETGCIHDYGKCVRVNSSHIGMAVNPAVYREVVQALYSFRKSSSNKNF